jgi:arylsulfatase A-like enzyme
MHGKSVLPLATHADPDFRKEWLYEYYEYPNPENVAVHCGIRTDRYKLIHYYKDQPEAFELYDLETDPHETQNLYGRPEHTALQQHLLDRLQKLQAAVPERADTTPA